MVENVVIMAGGAGKRLWPASMGNKPKPFLCVEGRRSLFFSTLERAFQLGISGHIYVVIHQDHVPAALGECSLFQPGEQRRISILAEPRARNTAPALALASAALALDGRESETVLVMGADYLISPFESFKSSVETAAAEAENDTLVTFGIVPVEPATGYGYIESGAPLGGGFEVSSFREKPSARIAAEYAASGHHFWNSGMFVYRSMVLTRELQKHSPDVAGGFTAPRKDWFRTSSESGVTLHTSSPLLKDIYNRIPAESIDYAIMEKTRNIRMVKAEFGWNDVGSWDVIAGLANSGFNSHPVYNVESSGNFVYADLPVALCGVEDLIVVVANGRVMVCKKGMSQLVKDAAEADLASQ